MTTAPETGETLVIVNCAGRTLASARPLIGSVLVLDANTADAASCASACRVTPALMAR